MQIKWVNHASYILEHEDIKIISDPWLDGKAFNESWALLSETKLKYSEFNQITHIWFSHEHPDHFSPANIGKIPLKFRNNITVLYQKTKDSKVVAFCEKAGFKSIVEIDEFETILIGENMQATIGKVQNDTDSWLHIKTPDSSILNLNDCVFTDAELIKIRETVGVIDLLLTQFSFANWVGNKYDKAAMKSSADRKLNEIKKHIECFKPKFTIPFASYVWFCNEDNFHFNEFANKIDFIHDYITKLGSTPIILYPADEWEMGQDLDSSKAIVSYMADLASLAERKRTKFDSLTTEELTSVVNQFIAKAFEQNNKWKLSTYKPMIIHLTDLDEVISISYKQGLKKVDISPDKADISFHSQNLFYCLKFDWGFDTILVAGTFQKPKNGNFQNFMEYQWVATLNNQGKRMKGLLARIEDKIVKSKRPHFSLTILTYIGLLPF